MDTSSLRYLSVAEASSFIRSLKRRRRKGEPLGQFAVRAGFHHASWYRWTHGGRIRISKAVAICRRLAIPFGSGTNILDAPTSGASPDKLRLAARRTPHLDDLGRVDLVGRAAHLLQQEALREGMTPGLIAIPGGNPSARVEVVKGGVRRAVEFLIAGRDLTYFLLEGDDPAVCGVGDFTKTALSFCCEFLGQEVVMEKPEAETFSGPIPMDGMFVG